MLARPRTGWRLFLAIVHAAAAGALLAWATGRLGSVGWAIAVAAAGGALIAGVVGWRAAAATPRRLAWTGQTWTVGPPDGPSAAGLDGLDVMLDLGPWMLLRAPGGRWFTVSRADAGGEWRAFRAAVYCPALSSTPGSPAEPAPH